MTTMLRKRFEDKHGATIHVNGSTLIVILISMRLTRGLNSRILWLFTKTAMRNPEQKEVFIVRNVMMVSWGILSTNPVA